MNVADPALVEFAAEVGNDDPVAVRGGGTRWFRGGDVDPTARVVRAPSGIVDHRPEEMTVRVRAGTTVAELHDHLAGARQRTALPERPGGTVGGALAVGESAFTRLGRGQTRDALLQAVYVSAEGELVTAGGPTVKNVSGYDIPRLLVGSLGTIGLMGEVILRTQPVPEVERWVTVTAPAPDAVLAAVSTAASVLWDRHRTWVLLAGYEPDVDTDEQRLAALGDVGHDPVPELPEHRWSCTPSQSLTLDPSATGDCVVEVGVGVVHASFPAPRRPLAGPVRELANRIKQHFDPTGRLAPGRTVDNV